ncbi:MAG: hypothetical protein LBE23_09600 [Vagococcus sp.]|jgi:stalled ribosome alternative rescue factor ArfA|nr:hypothetical protein [Vagococcus sp.]
MSKVRVTLNLISKKNSIININLLNKFITKLKITKKIIKKNNLKGEFTTHIKNVEDILQYINKDELEWCMSKYKKNYYDILGSGWICFGNEFGRIDWNKKIYPQKMTDSQFVTDVDIKTIWELSRTYHLPQMALFLSSKNIEERNQIEEMIYHQILDLSNLPQSHECWLSPMDVAIRCCNQLVTLDICLKGEGSIFLDKNEEIKRIFDKYLLYLINNLELNYVDGSHGNHYLSNLVGILFICSYFGSDENKEIFDFASRELLIEIKKQILCDGSIYECSTMYSRLSSELLYFGIGILQFNEKNNQFYNEWHQLYKLLEFLNYCLVEENLIQVGDNDSGHLFKFGIDGKFKKINELKKININYNTYNFKEANYFDENDFSLKEVLGFYNLFINSPKVFDKSALSEVLCQIAGNIDIKIDKETTKELKMTKLSSEKSENFRFTKKIIFNLEEKNDSLLINYFEDFGLLKLSTFNKKNIVFIRLPFDAKNKLLAHVHDDIFSIQFYQRNKWKYKDKGSYLYTSNKNMRNYFRSSQAHFKPIFEEENIEFKDIFTSKSLIKNQETLFFDNKVIISSSWKNTKFVRYISFTGTELHIEDYSNNQFQYNYPDESIFSLGYGKINKIGEFK